MRHGNRIAIMITYLRLRAACASSCDGAASVIRTGVSSRSEPFTTPPPRSSSHRSPRMDMPTPARAGGVWTDEQRREGAPASDRAAQEGRHRAEARSRERSEPIGHAMIRPPGMVGGESRVARWFALRAQQATGGWRPTDALTRGIVTGLGMVVAG